MAFQPPFPGASGGYPGAYNQQQQNSMNYPPPGKPAVNGVHGLAPGAPNGWLQQHPANSHNAPQQQFNQQYQPEPPKSAMQQSNQQPGSHHAAPQSTNGTPLAAPALQQSGLNHPVTQPQNHSYPAQMSGSSGNIPISATVHGQQSPPEQTLKPTVPGSVPPTSAKPVQQPGFPPGTPAAPGFQAQVGPAEQRGFQAGPPAAPGYQPQVGPPLKQGFQPGPPATPGFQPQGAPLEQRGFQPGPPAAPGFQSQVGPPEQRGFQPGPPAAPGFQPQVGPSEQRGFQPGPPAAPGFQPQVGPSEQRGFQPGPPAAPGFQSQLGSSEQRGFQPGPPAAPGFQPQVGPSEQRGFQPGPPAAPGFQPQVGSSAQRGFQPGPLGGQPGYPPGPGGFQGPPGGQGQSGFPPGPGGIQGGPPIMGGAFPAGPGGFQGGPPGPPGAPSGVYPPGAMPQQRQRLDPNMMPSAVQVMDDDNVREGLFATGYPHAEAPPLTSTNFYAQDQGNANPKFIRSTLYVAPQSADILKHSQIPFVVAVSPFAELSDKERAPPVIDLGPQGPIRCQRCKAYMNPFMEFQDGGRRFRCLFCHASTPVEDAYFSHLDHTGRRTDIDYRPELQYGAYEFVATKQYCKNGVAPKEPAFIFMIDVSYNAVQNGMLSTLCANLDTILANLPKEYGHSESVIRVGFATFDQAIHFFDLSSATPSMMVVGDVADVFVPVVDGLLMPYSQAVHSIRALLAEIPRLFSQTRVTECILGPVVQAGMDALKCADRAGKLFIFSCSLPVMEAPGKLKNRDDRKLLGSDKEKIILTPQIEFYTKLGEQCVKVGCTVDLFLFPNAFIDVATIGQLTAVTGGSLYKYQYFDASKDSKRFLTDLQHDVSRQIAFDCMVRVRSSAGIRPVKFHGSFFMENTTDMEMASIDQDKAFFVELKHDDKLTDPNAVIQAAVLFTSVSGQRRLRILNLCLPVSGDYNHLYRVADQDTLSTYLLKLAVEMNREKGQKETKETITNMVARMLASYREKCSEQAPLGQLILPETLKIMPAFLNSILKNDAIVGGSEMTVDDKAWLIELIRGLKIEEAMHLIYPTVFAVSNLEIQEPSEICTLPQRVRASAEYMKNDTAYMIDNGVCLFLWIGLGVPEQWVQDVFGSNSVALIDTENHVIPERDNPKSRAVRRCLDLVQTGPRRRKVFIVREKDALEPWMKKFLVEDKTGHTGMSYVDYLCFIHREIRNILS